jgi:hypothetical protein
MPNLHQINRSFRSELAGSVPPEAYPEYPGALAHLPPCNQAADARQVVSPVIGNSQAPPPEFGRINDAVVRFGLSRSRLYLLAGQGLVRFVKVGTATIVDYSSVRDYIASLPSAPIRPPKSATA